MRFAPACLVLVPFLGAVLCRTEILDRIAVSVDKSVITEGEILDELRVEAFLNGEQPDSSPAARRKAADRMVERLLIQREMAFSRYPDPPPEDVDDALQLFVKAHYRGDEAACRAALGEARISEDLLKRSLEEQLRTMQFIEVRFRPAVQIPAREIQQYYDRTFLPAWRRQNGEKAPPALEDASTGIEKVLIESQVDRALDRWLGEARRQTRIRYREEVFR